LAQVGIKTASALVFGGLLQSTPQNLANDPLII